MCPSKALEKIRVKINLLTRTCNWFLSTSIWWFRLRCFIKYMLYFIKTHKDFKTNFKKQNIFLSLGNSYLLVYTFWWSSEIEMICFISLFYLGKIQLGSDNLRLIILFKPGVIESLDHTARKWFVLVQLSYMLYKCM